MSATNKTSTSLELTVREGTPEESTKDREEKEKRFAQMVDAWKRRARMNQTFMPPRHNTSE